MKRNFILFMLLVTVCGYATDEWKFDYETGAGNFTKKERVATGALNILPGVGSYFIMDDMTGAIVQWSLSGAGVALPIFYGIFFNGEDCSGKYGYGNNDYENCHDNRLDNQIQINRVGLAFYCASFIYNIYRSITYDKPKQTAFSENSGFNIAVLPNRNGKLNAFLMFNKAF